MVSRWPIRLLSVVLAAWYARLGMARRARPAEPQRILIAHNLLLGDTIMLAPLLKKLRTRFPEADIVMTCRPGLVQLFAGRPYGVRVVPFDPRHVDTFWSLYRERGFDLALLPMDNRYSWLARSVDSRWVIAFEGDRPAYKNWPVDELQQLPDSAMAFGDLLSSNLVDGPASLPYQVSDWPTPPAPSFEIPTKPYCVLHLGAGSPLRYWEPGKWIELIAYLEDSDIQPVLSTGPGEAHLVENVDPKSVLPCFPGSLSLPQVFRLLSESSAVVCPDTGIAHLARLVGVPTVVLFGPGSTTMFGGGEFWRNAPSRNVTIANFPCRNQNIIFRRNLPWSQHCARTTKQCAAPKCMEALTFSMVRDAFESMRNELGF